MQAHKPPLSSPSNGRRRHRRLVSALAAVTIASSGALVLPSPVAVAAAQAAPGQWYLHRGRLLNDVPMAAGATLTVQVAGESWLPGSNLDTVALNVSAKGGSATGALTIYPSGEAEATATALSYDQVSHGANLVIAKVGADGKIKLVNKGSGAANVYLDVHGYSLKQAGLVAGSKYVALPPQQIVNKVSVPAYGNYEAKPLGKGGLPAVDVQAAAISISGLSKGTGTVRVYAAGDVWPADATLDYAANVLEQNFALAKIGSGGVVNVHNFGSQPVEISINTLGYFTTANARTEPVNSVKPSRIAGDVTIEPGAEYKLSVLGKGGLPSTRPSAVGLNLTAMSKGSGQVTISSPGLTGAEFNSLAYAPDSAVSTFSAARVGCDGQVTLLNTGTDPVTVSVDAFSYFGVPANTAASGTGAAGTIEQTTTTTDLNRQVSTDTTSAAIAGCSDDQGTSTVSVPKQATDGVTLQAEGRDSIKLALPAAGPGTMTAAGTVLFPGSGDGHTTAVQLTQDGGFRTLVHIDNASAPTTYDFPLTLPQGVRAEVDEEDGSIELLRDSAGGVSAETPEVTADEVVGRIDKPWAKDAAGRTWPTSYTVENGVLKLAIDLSPRTEGGETITPKFPVVADPKISFGWSIYVRWNRRESAWMADAPMMQVSTMVSAVACSNKAFKTVAQKALCAFVVGASAQYIHNSFKRAKAHNACHEVKFDYSGGLDGWRYYVNKPKCR